jgi:cytochrome P450 family 628
MVTPLAELMLLGILSHLTVFIHGELNNFAGQIASTFAGFFGLLAAIGYFQAGPVYGIAIAAANFAAFQLGLLLSIVIYRAYFHRLKDFPGLPIMGVTQLWAVCNAIVVGRNHAVIADLHHKHGDFVRVGRPKPEWL